MTREQILQLISFIDLTTLNDRDNEESVLQMLEKANKGVKGVYPACICVFPDFSDLVKSRSNLNIAVVGGCFPTWQTHLEAKVAELEIIGKTAANEIDIAINRRHVAAANYHFMEEEIVRLKKAVGGKSFKMIIESGELSPEEIKETSRVSLLSGANFIKTSTGKIEIGATLTAAQIICDEILLYYESTGNKAGFKASGGISTFDDAMVYWTILQKTLGAAWLTPEFFRIGASTLYDNLIADLNTI